MTFIVFLTIALIMYLFFCLWLMAVTWLLMDKVLRTPPNRIAKKICRILKWPSLIGAVMFTVANFVSPDENVYFDLVAKLFSLLSLLAWWAFRNLGDDQEPKQKKRVRARIKQVGGRLVIVPGASA